MAPLAGAATADSLTSYCTSCAVPPTTASSSEQSQGLFAHGSL